ncbi:hypothetical protein [Streptomyces sp. NPDC046909]|uniref:hypothetical protein n=1 Tax=Streptomyces sp. NPDC046909 TaxID=3155617 RepID=UPI0033E7FE9D
MPDTPVPIPSGSVPAGAPAWLSADAARWVRARPASWARPLWSVSALLLSVAWAIAVEPEPVCSEAAPCGPDWGGAVQMGLAVGLLYWLARVPELALICAPALAVIVPMGELPGAGGASQAANITVIVALVFGWAGACERLAARSRQRRLAEQASGTRHRLPGPAGPLGRGVIPTAAALVLCAMAVGSVVLGLRGIRADDHHAVRAVRITGTVVSRGEDWVRVRTDDARRLTVDAAYPEDYRIGSTVAVLEDGSWRRLVAEPYDAVGWQLLAAAAALPGLSLLTAGVFARRRAAALRRGPVPALQVLERLDQDGRTWVYAADDAAGRVPLFGCLCVAMTVDENRSGDSEGAAVVEWDDEHIPVLDVRLREAVMFGAPHDGGELVFVTTRDDGDPVLIRTVGPVRPPKPRKGPASKVRAVGSTWALSQERVDEVAAVMTPAGRSLRWGPGAVARAGGLALLAVAVTGAGFFAHDTAANGIGWHSVLLLGMLWWIGPAAVQLNWRVTADRTGLWLTGAWTVRHFPWEQVKGARYTREGSIEFSHMGGSTWQLPGLGIPRAERLLRRHPPYVRMVEEVTALHLHPQLRPVESSPPREHGLPLGPALLVLVGLAAAISYTLIG